ncbi:LytTR family DNA-binding domain-containing protein [Spirosoma harenae]
MFRLLNQPYPSDKSLRQVLQKALLIGIFVALFLLTFQPFSLNLWDTPYKTLKIAGFGLVTFLITATNFIIWQQVFPRFFTESRWTVGREILFMLWHILIIAIANRFYLEWLLGISDTHIMGWGHMILGTFLVGLFPVVALVMLNYIRQLKKYSRAAADLPVPIHETPGLPEQNTLIAQVDETITLVADNDKDTITLLTEELLFIESSDNYCTIVHRKNGRLTKPLLRSSLGRLEKQISRPYIVRCHRSYVVNLNQIERVTGNAQGYKLHLSDGQFQIPVARQYNETLVAELKAL